MKKIQYKTNKNSFWDVRVLENWKRKVLFVICCSLEAKKPSRHKFLKYHSALLSVHFWDHKCVDIALLNNWPFTSQTSYLLSQNCEPCRRWKYNNAHTGSDRTPKQKILSDGALPTVAKQFVTASRVFAISICDNLRGDHLREWQRLSPCVTFCGERRDAFETAAPLSDMAVPKALPGTARPLEEEEPATSLRPICKQNHWETFPTRHHLAASLTCP